MTDVTFTGERLHVGNDLFSIDLARHDAAYEVARRHVGPGSQVLELGSGSGYGATSLADGDATVVAIDRVPPDSQSRQGRCRFVRGDLDHLPLRGAQFDLVVSFQVIEHLEDPTGYVDAIADLLAPGGLALVTTPNRLMSDGVNPYHVHEYLADELADCLGRRFEHIDVQGIGASDAIASHLSDRSQRIQRIMRLDPLRLRDRLPKRWIEWLFATFAIWVRSQGSRESAPPNVSWRDFPVGPADDACLDLLAVCRRPR